MSHLRHALLIAPLVFLASCSPLELRFDHDRSADFSKYHTYQWTSRIPAKEWDKAVKNDLMIRRVVDQVDRNLASRTFQKLDTGEPDFLVIFTPLMRSRMVTNSFYSYGGGFSETRRVGEAGLQLDILDGKTRRVIWSAFASGSFARSEDPAETDKEVAEAVDRILANFPPAK
jgi:hypothetical protein